MKTAKQNLVLFFGVVVMLIGVMINGMLFQTFSNILVDVGQLPKFVMWSYLFNLIGSLGLLFMTMKGQIRRGFHILFPVHLALLVALLCTGPLTRTFFGPFFYLWGSFSMVAFPVLVWGYANQIFRFRSAALFYPLLGIIGAIFMNVFFVNILGLFQNSTITILMMILGAGLTYKMFLFLSSKELGTKETGRKISWGYWFALVLFVLGIGFAPQIQKILFKWQFVEVFTRIEDLGGYTAEKRVVIGIMELIGLVIGGAGTIALGILLYFKGSKWWGGVSTLLVSCALITSFVYFYSSYTEALSEKSLFLFAKESALMGSFIVMLLGLKELAYFAIPLDKRFTAKCLIDIILLTLFGGFTTQIASFVASKGEIGSQVFLLGALCICGFLIALVGIVKIGSDFRKKPRLAA